MLFNGGKLARNEQMDRRCMFMKTNNPRRGVLSAKLISSPEPKAHIVS